jgi:hypothetical protein
LKLVQGSTSPLLFPWKNYGETAIIPLKNYGEIEKFIGKTT